MKTKGWITTEPVGCKHLFTAAVFWLHLYRLCCSSTHSFSIMEGFLVTLQLCSVFSQPPSKVVKTISLFTSSMIVSRAAPTFFIFFSVSIIFSIALWSITRQEISRLFSCPQSSAIVWGKVVSSEVFLKYDDYLGWFGAHMGFNHLWSC